MNKITFSKYIFSDNFVQNFSISITLCYGDNVK